MNVRIETKRARPPRTPPMIAPVLVPPLLVLGEVLDVTEAADALAGVEEGLLDVLLVLVERVDVLVEDVVVLDTIGRASEPHAVQDTVAGVAAVQFLYSS